MNNPETEIIICPMTENDLDQVLAIEAVSYPRPWLRQHFLDELASANSDPLCALDQAGRVIGYICPMRLLDEAHILNVAVSPSARGRGVGEMLVRRVLEDSGSEGAAFVSLEVRVSNLAAIALYKKLGFAEVGRRRRYYENGEDALMMEYLYR